MKKKILISGIGVAGIVTALSLDQQEYEIDIIERAPEYRNIGYSITLWKAGFDLLMEIFERYGIPVVEGKDYFKVSGFNLFGDTNLKKLKWLDASGYAWVFERAHLMGLLEEIFEQTIPRDVIRFGTIISLIEQNDNFTVVTTSDGRQKSYDAVIVAEGINSTTRNSVFHREEQIITLAYSLRYAWFTTPSHLEENGGLLFAKGHIGVIHPPYTRNLLGYYSRTDLSPEKQRQFEGQVRNSVRQPDGSPIEIDLTTSHVFELKEVHLPRYNYGNIIFVGDSAHGRPPTLGFGTTLAVEDAVLIARMLTNISDKKISSMFSIFSNIRAKRIEQIYKFQNFIHKFITESNIKARIIAWCLKVFYAHHIEKKIKKFAKYKI